MFRCFFGVQGVWSCVRVHVLSISQLLDSELAICRGDFLEGWEPRLKLIRCVAHREISGNLQSSSMTPW